jgi:5-formyltetrahydrofolate cyclo-ligase
MTSNQEQKSTIRRSIRTHRNSLSESQRKIAGLGLAEQLQISGLLGSSQRMACFLSFDGEISTQPTIQLALSLNKHCYLPKLRPYKPNRLWFMPYDKKSNMMNNRYGIPEVDLAPQHAIAVSKLDLVLLPLVAFDSSGNRLGMGGGFYDATFEHLRSTQKRPKLIGLAYQAQQVSRLPSDSWDLPLDGVCTEESVFIF